VNRDDFEKFVIQNYDASFDYPWKKSPKNEVFRHKNSKKWFALVMNVQKKWLGSDEEGVVDVVNLKCDKELVGSLQKEHGIFKAYHMNKENWVTVVIDGGVSDEKLKSLVRMSYDLTSGK